ncbi:hypothetical protein P3W45_001329 [Vairimorpha bombi]|jgi:hypothetical protein
MSKKVKISTENRDSEVETASSEYDSSDISSDDLLDCIHVKDLPIEDFNFLLGRTKFFSETDPLYNNLLDKAFVTCNDIVLYYILLIDYTKILSLVDKKIKKHINNLIVDSKVDKEDLVMIYADKLCNIDVKEVVESLRSLNFYKNNYLFVSKCYHPSQEEKEEFLEVFSDFKEEGDNLEILPVRIEEIFLNKISKFKKNMQVSSAPYQMFILGKEDIEEYVKILEKEIN